MESNLSSSEENSTVSSGNTSSVFDFALNEVKERSLQNETTKKINELCKRIQENINSLNIESKTYWDLDEFAKSYFTDVKSLFEIIKGKPPFIFKQVSNYPKAQLKFDVNIKNKINDYKISILKYNKQIILNYENNKISNDIALKKLEKYTCKFAESINFLFTNGGFYPMTFESIKSEIKSRLDPVQIKRKFTADFRLVCNFSKAEQNFWLFVENDIEKFLNKNIFINLKPIDFKKSKTKKIFCELTKESYAQWLLLQEKINFNKSEKLYLDIERKEVDILQEYQIKLTRLVSEFEMPKTKTNSFISIFNFFNKLFEKQMIPEELYEKFYSAIAESIYNRYIPILETAIQQKIRSIYGKMGKDKPSNYLELEKYHWDNFLNPQNAPSFEEYVEKLSDGNIFIVGENKNEEKWDVLLEPLLITKDFSEEQRLEAIDRYLLLTEKKLSAAFGQTETLLTKFREIGYYLLTQGQNINQSEESASYEDIEKLGKILIAEKEEQLDSPLRNLRDRIISIVKEIHPRFYYNSSPNDVCVQFSVLYKLSENPGLLFKDPENKYFPLVKAHFDNLNKVFPPVSINQETESILTQNKKLFSAFAPAMISLQTNTNMLSADGPMAIIENQLKKSNPEVMKNYSLPEIARMVFRIHLILNQDLMERTLESLIKSYRFIYPNDSAGIFSLEEMNKGINTRIYVFVKMDQIQIEWRTAKQLYSADWQLTQLLRIKFPPIKSPMRGKIEQKFILTSTLENHPSHKMDEKSLVIQPHGEELLKRILAIRNLLKILEFPPDSFVYQELK